MPMAEAEVTAKIRIKVDLLRALIYVVTAGGGAAAYAAFFTR